MAKSEERVAALALRRAGQSVKEIARKLSVSPASVSVWTRDMVLTDTQRAALREHQIAAGHKGRMIGAAMNHAKKLERIREANAIGTETCRSLNNRELLLAGACLYWGEGSKSGQLSIVNSDPQLLIFFMRWLQQCFGVNAEDFMPRIYINEVHESRLATVRAYWSETLGIPEQRFRTTILVRTKQKKIYENHDRHYGQVTIRVRNSTDIRYKILGLIYGLKNSSLGV